MNKSDLIAKLQESIAADGDHHIGMSWLMEMAFAGSRALKEQKARAKIIREIIRAKHAAGFPRSSVFFRDVWPVALAALKNSREKKPGI